MVDSVKEQHEVLIDIHIFLSIRIIFVGNILILLACNLETDVM